jgi:DNA-binding NarL/FixJ family response regulator
MRTPIRLLIADDHALLREGLKALLMLEPDIQVIAEIARADQLNSALAATPCDILVLDLKLDRSVIGDIGALAKKTKVVVLTGSERFEDALAALRQGARAIVQKKFAIKPLVDNSSRRRRFGLDTSGTASETHRAMGSRDAR